MKLQTREREAPEVNLTSLIDVVLLLLVFFMVSTSFVREAEINLRLPEADADARLSVVEDGLEISISRTGNYFINGRELINNDRRTLRTAIERLAGDSREIPVTIRGDAESTLQAFVTATEVVGQLGFTQVQIAAVTTSDE
ncbi:MAG TPA: biopolymer transporter ExbD [Gammaproteobacteria bacterium]|nr:biopolymer transporter ExbD [Gammaproteobacteria bacterium]